MKSRFFVFALLTICLIFVSCNPFQEKAEADNAVEGYFEAVKSKDFEKALSFYSPDFFSITPREEWKQSLETINQKLGDLKSYKQTSWRLQSMAGTRTGTVYEVRYTIEYENFSAEEEIQLFKPAGTTEVKIVKHQINSKGFLQ